jgi:hypothetical protein
MQHTAIKIHVCDSKLAYLRTPESTTVDCS